MCDEIINIIVLIINGSMVCLILLNIVILFIDFYGVLNL